MLQIRLERQKRGWTLAEISKRTGIAAPDLSRIETGLLPVYPSWRRRLVQVFQMSADVLFVPADREGS